MRSQTGRPGSGGDAGFTLVELIIAIAIIGIITVPLGDVIIGYLRNTDATTARLLESHDVQIASAYWAQDVASIGLRIGLDEPGFDTTPYALKPSVAVGTESSLSSLPVCPATGTPIVRLAWDSFSGPGGKSIVQVAYILKTKTELHRIRCDGSVVSSDVTLTHDLDPLTPPALACPQPGEPAPPPPPTPTCTPWPAAPKTLPKTFLLYLSMKDQNNRGGPYSVVLAGQRRQ